MSQLAARLFVAAACCFQGVASDTRWRETLLEQARLRIQSWYADPDLTEAPQTRNGITLRMLKKDMLCGGDVVPVTFAEFDVVGARPVDIFNTMLDTAGQTKWNRQCSSATALGDWEDKGARGWAVVFDVPFVEKREFVQWQVSDADLDKEDFWLVFSTQGNDELRKKHTMQKEAVDSQNCLGAYHITKNAKGSHVIVTQHVNAHPPFMFPLHKVLDFFPPAWQGTVDFVKEMSDNARQLSASGSSADKTDAPAFMLRQAALQPRNSVLTPSVAGLRVMNRAEVFPMRQPKAAGQAQARLGPLESAALILLIPGLAVIGFKAGRFVANRMEASMQQGITRNEASPELEHEEALIE